MVRGFDLDALRPQLVHSGARRRWYSTFRGKTLGLSVAGLAEHAGIPRQYVYDLEGGIRRRLIAI